MNTDILKKIAQEVVKFKDQGNTTTNTIKVQRSEGARFYKGTSVGPGSMFKKNQATTNAILKSQNNPSNSVTAKQAEQFRGYKK